MILIDRRYFRYFDAISFLLVVALSCISLLFVYSATSSPACPYSIFLKKQSLGILSGFGIYLSLCLLDFRSLMRWGYFIYFFILGLLFFTLIKGSMGMGAQRWINLGIIKFQPSELAKIFMPSFIAFYFQTADKERLIFKDFLPIIGIVGLSFLLILRQPDLGTALLILFTGAVMLRLAGLARRFYLYAILLATLSAPFTWHMLKPYQQQRIIVFLGQGDAQKEGYQLEQSKIAIGSGGLFGKGFKQGTQNKLMFLPESRTDFIFAVIGEEWGLLGALFTLALLAALFIRNLMIALTIEEPFYQLMALGLLTPYCLGVLINTGMVTGLLPIVGIPLPFMSYGITHLWITFASFGWLNSIAIRRFYTGIAERRTILTL